MVSFGGLSSQLRYDFPDGGGHELISHMEDVLIGSFKTLPGYIDRDFSAVIFGFDAGYFVPTGPWNNHPYAEGVALFDGGPTLAAEIEKKLTSVGFSLGFSYSWLMTGEWETYAREKGESLSGSAHFYTIDFLFKVYLWVTRNYLFKLDIGFNYLQAGGRETYNENSYNYDFLTWGLGLSVGIEYDRFISQHMAFAIHARYVNALNVIDYSNDRTYNLAGFQINLGIKYYY
jgi:hypothetical protein